MSVSYRQKVREGFVVSDKMDKTVVVEVERTFQHPVYRRTVRRSKKYKAHDPQNSYRIGDRVRIVETRPLSKEKRWRVIEVIKRPETVPAEEAIQSEGSEEAKEQE